MNSTISIQRASQLAKLAPSTLVGYAYHGTFTEPKLDEYGDLYFDTEVFLLELLRYWTDRQRRYRRTRVEHLVRALAAKPSKDVSYSDLKYLAYTHADLRWVIGVAERYYFPAIVLATA